MHVYYLLLEYKDAKPIEFILQLCCFVWFVLQGSNIDIKTPHIFFLFNYASSPQLTFFFFFFLQSDFSLLYIYLEPKFLSCPESNFDLV